MKKIIEAVKILQQGGVVAYPTDTAYGLAVDATNIKAVQKLYKLKGRNFKKPVHVITPDIKWLHKMVELNPDSLKLMNKFIPGPITLILPLKLKGKSWQMLSGGTRALGVRIPNNKTAQALVMAFGKPITGTSANLSGQPVCYSVAEIKKQFVNSKLKPDFYLDGGRLKKTNPSTVVSLAGRHVKILREGPISETQIKQALK